LREECRLRVVENRALRRIFEPKREEKSGEWSRLHNEELLVQWLGLAQSIEPNRIRLLPFYPPPPNIFYLMTKAEPVFETL
jgi:hypothetical protein